MDPGFAPEPAALFREQRITTQNSRHHSLLQLPPRLRSLRSRSLVWASFAVAQARCVNPFSELLRKN